MKTRFSRRRFIQGIAAAGAILPLSVTMSRSAYANNTAPKRVVFFHMPDGITAPYSKPDLWFPTNNTAIAGNGFDNIKRIGNLNAQNQTGFANIKDKLTMFTNMDMNGGVNHNAGTEAIMRNGGGTTLNHLIGDFQKQTNGNLLFPTYYFGTRTTGVWSHGNYISAKGGSNDTPVDNPAQAYLDMFASDATGVDYITNRKLSVIDRNRAELTNLKNSLPAAEQQKLEEHLNSLFELEQRLRQTQNGDGASCLSQTPGSSHFDLGSGSTPYHAMENFDTVMDMQLDMAFHSLACDKTRSIAFSMSNHTSTTVVPGTTGQGHGLSHSSSSEFNTNRNYYCSKIARLAQMLENTPENDGSGQTMLDNTLMYMCSDVSDSNGHDNNNMPIVLVGGGSEIEGGRVIDAKVSANLNGAHESALISIANFAGMNISSFGQHVEGAKEVEGLRNLI